MRTGNPITGVDSGAKCNNPKRLKTKAVNRYPEKKVCNLLIFIGNKAPGHKPHLLFQRDSVLHFASESTLGKKLVIPLGV